jgi:hypothetical protein
LCKEYDIDPEIQIELMIYPHLSIATKVMYSGVSAGIILAVISLYIYDMHFPYFSAGQQFDSLNLVCVMLLVVGSEVYHQVSIKDVTFETG